MPLSTSSSSDRAPKAPWLFIWVSSLAIVVVAVVFIESYWRGQGFKPSVADSPDLWALQRSRVYMDKGEAPVIILGASRAQLGLSKTELKRQFPGRKLVNLAVDGSCPYATLHDLANDELFAGLVIVSFREECILSNQIDHGQQHDYVNYFNKDWNLNKRVQVLIQSSIDSKLALLDPVLRFKELAISLLRRDGLPKANYTIMDRLRFRQADYSMVDINAHRQHRAQQASQLKGAEKFSHKDWLESAIQLNSVGNKISERGGEVIYIKFPVSGVPKEVDNELFPRALYWDNLASLSTASFIHADDLSHGRPFLTPDGSHIDISDSVRFTREVVRAINNRQ